MRRKPLIIFDMDGVLVDVTGSYREVTRLTVIFYLSRVLGARIEDNGFLSLSDVAAIKKSGGLNNDWVLTDTIINTYLTSALHGIDGADAAWLCGMKNCADDRVLLREVGLIMENVDLSPLEILVKEKNVQDFYSLSSRGSSSQSPLLLNHGDVTTGNLSKRIFQEIYLGADLFEEIYGEKPIFYRADGYIEREHMIPSSAQLHEIASSYTLSIATGRPEVEARYTLAQFGTGRYFLALVSEDDVFEAERSSEGSLRKPHPFSLNLCLERSGYTAGDRVYYIGDMPDDMVAAQRAGIVPLGFVDVNTRESADEKRGHRVILEKKGAVAVFGDFQELISFLMNH